LDKKQDIYRIGLIEEFKFQKRDKLTSKKAEISIKQFYRLDEIPPSVLSNEGEFDTHVMPQNFPEWVIYSCLTLIYIIQICRIFTQLSFYNTIYSMFIFHDFILSDFNWQTYFLYQLSLLM